MGIPVVSGETTGVGLVDPKLKWCSNTPSLIGLDGWASSAVGTGGSKTSTADITCDSGAIQAASDYAGGSKTDWFLPSVGEAMLMYINLRQVGVGGFARDNYWSSSELEAIYSWQQHFGDGRQTGNGKIDSYYVRPARAF